MRVDVELNVGDAPGNGLDLFKRTGVHQQPGRPPEKGVSQDLKLVQGHVRQHTNGNGRTGIDERAKGAGHIKFFQIFKGEASRLLDNDLQDGVHGRLGTGQRI